MDNIRRRLTDSVEMGDRVRQRGGKHASSLEKLDFFERFSVEATNWEVSLKTDRDYRPELSQFLYQNGYLPLSMKAKEMSLEEAFITITQQNISLLARGEEAA